MAAAAARGGVTTAYYAGKIEQQGSSLHQVWAKLPFDGFGSGSGSGSGSGFGSSTSSTRRRILPMASKKKVNKYDPGWKKEWFGAGIFLEGSEDVEVDVFKKAEKRKVLSNVEKSGVLSKAEGLGLTLSSIEKLGVLSKAEQFGLLSLLENSASLSPSALASAALPLLLAALAVVLLVPDDSFPLVAAQAAFSTSLVLASAAFFLASLLLDALQEEDAD